MYDKVEERAKAASQYVDSLYNKTPYQLREELRKLYTNYWSLKDHSEQSSRRCRKKNDT